jgi:murein DD-endopeptidase MepM/ murein hydrolase activator NlpD
MLNLTSCSVRTPRLAKLGGQLSMLALLTGLGAGCSSMIPVNEPVFTGSTTNQRDLISGQSVASADPVAAPPAYRTGGSASVQGADLPPPAGASTSSYNAARAAPASVYQPPAPAAPTYAMQAPSTPKPYSPPTPYASPGPPKPIGHVAEATRKPNAPGATLAQLGAPPSTLTEQASRLDPPPMPTPRPSEAVAHRGGAYTVQPGDTMYSIARRNGVPLRDLVAANGNSPVARVGTQLTIPGGGSTRSGVQLASVDPHSLANAPAAVPAVAPKIPKVATAAEILPTAGSADQPTEPPAAAQPQQLAFAPQTGAAGAQAPAVPQASAGNADAADAFRWPVRGRVISGFGRKPNGERNDGINLAVPEGTAVKAAEDGTVIYAGNELKSYGNLVLIRHANGWVSAYAHNSALKVKRGAQVRRGEIIALSGMSGGVTTPQVHFELRHDASPVDPLQHLSES